MASQPGHVVKHIADFHCKGKNKVAGYEESSLLFVVALFKAAKKVPKDVKAAVLVKKVKESEEYKAMLDAGGQQLANKLVALFAKDYVAHNKHLESLKPVKPNAKGKGSKKMKSK